MDRIDIQFDVHAVPYKELSNTRAAESSEMIRTRVIAGLAGEDDLAPKHLSETVQYRTLDRNLWV